MPNDVIRQEFHIVAAAKRQNLPDYGGTYGTCPKCANVLQTGFGLAGGGYGVYEYCDSDSCQRVVTKTEVAE